MSFSRSYLISFRHEINWDLLICLINFQIPVWFRIPNFKRRSTRRLVICFCFLFASKIESMLIPWMIVHSHIVEPNICDDPKKLHKWELWPWPRAYQKYIAISKLCLRSAQTPHLQPLFAQRDEKSPQFFASSSWYIHLPKTNSMNKHNMNKPLFRYSWIIRNAIMLHT